MTRFILPLLFIVVSIGLFFGYVDATYEHIKVLRVQNDEFTLALEQARELEEIQNQLRGKYNTFSSEDLTRLKKLLPDNVDNVRLILDIDHVAEAHDVRVSSLKLEEGKTGVAVGAQGKPYESATMSFSVSASYEVFLEFLKDLEASLRIIDPVRVSFTASEVNLYTYAVSIHTYWLK